jgi:hypothetical protein
MEGQNKPQTKGLMRRRKGWIGFVQNYPDWVKACDEGAWDNIKWGTVKGVKDVNKDAMGKITYKF